MTITTSRHVLICRNDNIGDVILTLPITAWLKKNFPSIKISFMCRAYAAPMVRICKTVDQVVELENVYIDPVAYFKSSDADTVIFAKRDRVLIKAAFNAGIENRIGNACEKLYPFLFCNRRVYFSKKHSPLHEAQLNFEFLRPFGLKEIPSLDEIRKRYDFLESSHTLVDQYFNPENFNLIIHTKSNGNGREWSISHYETLAEQLSAYPHIQLWVTGSAAEGEWLAQHASKLLQSPNVHNVCGKFTLTQLIDFIRTADGLVASGTGPLHIAASTGQRALGLYPPRRLSHPRRWAPVGMRAEYLCLPQVDCKKCKNGYAMTCACMVAIHPDVVTEIVLRWVQEKKSADKSQSSVR